MADGDGDGVKDSVLQEIQKEKETLGKKHFKKNKNQIGKKPLP